MKNIFNATKFIYGFLEEYISKYQHLMKGKLVDVGCGNKPFEHIFKNIDSYYGVDINKNSKADLICDVLDLKVNSNSADSVFCTQVLEHVNNPFKLVSEISRITKSGGTVILTAPHISRVHGAPFDFFRFTRYGLEHLFKINKFKIIKIEGMGGFFLSITYLINFYLREGNLTFKLLSCFINPLINLFYIILKPLDKSKNHTFNYIIVAKKL